MKTTLQDIIAITLIFSFIIGMAGIVGNIETHYNRYGIIIDVSDKEVTVEDSMKREWVFYGDNYKVGQRVEMKMYTKGTDSDITDDEILNVKVLN